MKKENINCSNLGEIEKPDDKRTCTYIPECTASSWKEGEYGLCTDGFKTRSIEKTDTCEGGYIPDNKIECKQKQVFLFKEGVKEFTTLIDNGKYSDSNNNNLKIKVTGELSSAKLITKARTTIKDGKIIKIPEYYYLLFSLSDKNIPEPRIIGTSRIKNNGVDMNDIGIFQGTETPKTLEFNLSSLKTAYPKGKIGSENINYVDIINKYNGKELNITLYLGDGISMLRDEMNRIYGTIFESYIEYECKKDSICSIQKIPNLDL